MAAPIIFNGSVAKLLTSGLKIPGSTSGTLTLSPSATTTSYSLVFPNAQGAASTFLQNDGSGNLSFAAAPQALNFIGLNGSWAVSSSTDRDAEISIGNWVNYVSGTTIPTILTGGSPSGNMVLSRTTTAGEILDGSASFKIVKSAISVQGEGVSVPFNVPKGYMGTTSTITMSLKILSGTIVAGDILLYVYDSTNSVIITPYNNDILYSGGGLVATFAVPSNMVSGRLGIHFASTSATAVTFAFDDVAIKPGIAAYGLAGSNSKSDLTFTPNNFGTIPSSFYSNYRQGDRLHVKGRFVVGTTLAANASLTLPIAIDSSKMPASTLVIGHWEGANTAALTNISSNNHEGPIFWDGSDTSKVYFAFRSQTNDYSKMNANDIFTSGDLLTVEFDYPALGYDANVSMSESSTYKISSFLANGTRVTATPTALGQYRSYIRSGSSATTGTDSAPTTGPSVTDGMLINTSAYNAAGTAGAIQRYEVYVGRNKNVTFNWYANSGRQGFIDTTPQSKSSTSAWGIARGYDPLTGVAYVDALWTTSAGDTQHIAGSGITTAGGAETAPTSAYFDITVSENALAVGVQAPRSEVRVVTGNGYGSTNTAVRRFTTVQKNTGTAITYADSATLGGSFTINEDGVYAITYMDNFGVNLDSFGITVNGTQLTTSISALTDGSWRAASTQAQSSKTQACPWTGNLSAGDVVRMQTQTSAGNEGAIKNSVTIVKVSN